MVKEFGERKCFATRLEGERENKYLNEIGNKLLRPAKVGIFEKWLVKLEKNLESLFFGGFSFAKKVVEVDVNTIGSK